MHNIYIAPLSGIWPPTYVVMVDGKPRDYLTARLGKRLTWSEQNDIIAGYAEWYDKATTS